MYYGLLNSTMRALKTKKSCSSIESCGYTMDEMWDSLEPKLKEGMTLENHVE